MAEVLESGVIRKVCGGRRAPTPFEMRFLDESWPEGSRGYH